MFLVTGAAGFIGSHLAEALVARGERVRALIRQSSSRRFLPAVDLAYGDLARGDGIEKALDGVRVVIHAAGVTKALRPVDYYTGNRRASENLAQAVAGKGIRFVHVSSLAAAGPAVGGEPLTEDAEPHPVSIYGKSKLEAERAVRHLVPDAVIVRPPVVYGPRDVGVLEVLKPLSRGWSLQIAGGDRWFSAVYVQDLIEGLILAAYHPAAPGRTYYLSHSKPLSWTQFTNAAAATMHRPFRALRIPLSVARAVGSAAEFWSRVTGKPGMISRDKIAEAQCAAWTCDPTRAARELGFEARTPLEEGLARTMSWYKETGWLHY